MIKNNIQQISSFNQKITIQSMTNIKTAKVALVLKQVQALKKVGCDFVRVAILDDEDILALKTVVAKSPLPIIADIHFNYRYALLAIEAGVAKIRLNPNNIHQRDELKQIIDKAQQADIWIRIGVNCGSIPEDILKKYKRTPKAMLLTLDRYLKIFKEFHFKKIVISLKASDPLMNVEVNKLAAKKYSYPIHIGVTEAGTTINGCIKSTIGLAPLLLEKIGNTMRISISDDPCLEVKIAHKLLNFLKIEHNRVDIISCPTCGRLSYDMFKLVDQVEKYCENKFFPLTISILGCIVNGIGEGKHADIGVAGSNKKAIIFYDGKILKTIDANLAFKELKNLIDLKYRQYLENSAK